MTQEILSLLTISSTLLTVLLTAIYVYFTKQLVTETIKTRQEQYSPYISILFEERDSNIYLVICNNGNRSAKNIEIISDPDINLFAGKYKKEEEETFVSPMLKQSYLAPNQKYQTSSTLVKILLTMNYCIQK